MKIKLLRVTMDYAFILITACAVSIDALIGGFALSLKKNLGFDKVLAIGLITFIMCLPGALLGEAADAFLNGYVTLIGAAIFLLIGVRNIFSFKKELTDASMPALLTCCGSQQGICKESFAQEWGAPVAIGIAVGFDAAIANLSISMMGNSSVIVCAIFAAAHIFFVGLAALLTRLNVMKFLDKIFWLPGLILILIAVYKLTEIFI